MDPAAELTLQITCFLQTVQDAPSSPREWRLIPGHGQRGTTYADAVAGLAALAKPVVVGALDHPGYVAVWRPDALDAAERRHVEHTLRNQQAALAASLSALGVADQDPVAFEGWGRRIVLPASEVRRWLGEYALTWGWTIAPSTDADHAARLLVMKGGRTRSPGGSCAPRRAT